MGLLPAATLGLEGTSPTLLALSMSPRGPLMPRPRPMLTMVSMDMEVMALAMLAMLAMATPPTLPTLVFTTEPMLPPTLDTTERGPLMPSQRPMLTMVPMGMEPMD